MTAATTSMRSSDRAYGPGGRFLHSPGAWRAAAAALALLLVVAAAGSGCSALLPGSQHTDPDLTTGGASEDPFDAGEASADAPPAPHPQTSAALGYPVDFTRSSIGEGLSQSVVNAIAQDSRGFIWLGTQDGLNRYDGYSYAVMKHDPANPDTIGNNNVLALCEDEEGSLWIGTSGGGLDRLDHATGHLTHYVHDPDDASSLSHNIVQALFVDRQGNLWVGTAGSGLSQLDRGSGTLKHYRHSDADPDSLVHDVVQAIYQDSAGTLWIGTFGGLDRFDESSDRFAHYRSDAGDPGSLSHDSVQAIGERRDGSLWIGTGGGLSRMDRDGGPITRYLHDPTDPTTIAEDDVQTILIDRSGEIWIGTNGGGLDRFDDESGQFIHHRFDQNEPRSLSNDAIISSLEDDAGVLWYGTFGGGTSRFDPLRRKFAHFRADAAHPEGLNSNTVWSMWESGDGTLWVGTMGGGLNRLDLETGRAVHYVADPDDALSLSHNIVWSVMESPSGIVWAGTTVGLDRLDVASNRFSHYSTPAPVFAIVMDSADSLWLGTLGSGLGLLEAGSEQPTFFVNDAGDPDSISDNTVVDVVESSTGDLWIATFNGGLNRLDPGTREFTYYRHDPEDPDSIISDNVLSLYLDEEGILWIGTLNGLDRLDDASGAFTHFTEADGLPNNVVYGILEDVGARTETGPSLWLSTNRGLSRFSPSAGAVRNYDEGDGLQSREFNQGAAHLGASGEMFFGGINGFNAFRPELVADNPYSAPIVITDFFLFNEPVKVAEGSVLPSPIAETGAITLSYQDDFFAFEFASLHFSAPEASQYSYILEAFDKGWNDVGTRNFAGYTNVPPGEYVFQLRGTNGDGVWSDQGTALRISISPPFWQTWWFRALVGFFAAGSIIGVFAQRVRAIEARRRALEVQVAERTVELQDALAEVRRAKESAEAANQAKSAFLASVSHELRTPLNAILGFSQLMMRSARSTEAGGASLPPDQRDNLEVISRSGEHLLGLINDVLDMSKIEAGRATLNETVFDLHRMLDGLEEMFRLRAEGKGLELTCDLHPLLPQYVRADQGRLRQILMNLLGNAVKFTQEGGVTARCAADYDEGADRPALLRLKFEVEDTGPGIRAEEMQAIFDPFVQTSAGQRTQEGTGLGLAISREFARLLGGDLTVRSELGEGSTFSLEVCAEVAEEGPGLADRSERMVIGLVPGQPEYRLLIVDDKEANRRLLVKLLSPLGFATQEASDGQQAIGLWENWEPHLIFMDMRMPVVDGYEATRRIKATTRGQATVIVALTASALEEDRLVILSEGCDAYIRKPFRECELFDVIAKHLGVRYVFQEREEAVAAGPPRDTTWLELSRVLSALPEEWRDRLRRATIVGDLEQIRAVIEAVGEHELEPGTEAALVSRLTQLADNFDHDKILGLIDQAGGRDG